MNNPGGWDPKKPQVESQPRDPNGEDRIGTGIRCPACGGRNVEVVAPRCSCSDELQMYSCIDCEAKWY